MAASRPGAPTLAIEPASVRSGPHRRWSRRSSRKTGAEDGVRSSHRAEVEALLLEHHEIRTALVQGRCALSEGDTRASLLAIASFRLHQIREESGVYQHLALHGPPRVS